jgi:TRAP-type C4-dicarboxylate transport system permease small subunit
MQSGLLKVLAVLILVLLLVWTVWPIALVAVAGTIASSHGCTLDESTAHPCVVNGEDIGGTLYGMGVMGWFMLVTIPTGGAALAIYVLILLGIWIVRRLRRNRTPHPAAEQPATQTSA